VILVCGEALVDLAPADASDADAYRAYLGGGPFNTAVALGRLQVPTAFLGRLSTDAFGRRLRRHLEANGVDTRMIVDAPEPTTLALVALSDEGDASYSFYVEGTADRGLAPEHLPPTLPDEARAIHLGSLALVLEPGASTLETLVHRERGRRVVSLDPNVRPAVIGDEDGYRDRVERLMPFVDVVRVSRDDLRWLDPAEPATIAARWLAAGVALVVVTAGAQGAVAYHGQGEVSAPSAPGPVVDTIGAGDAFNAGILAWLHDSDRLRHDRLAALRGGDLAQGLRFAVRVAAVTCTRAGADPPHRADLGHGDDLA
jgi:fructokinase